MNQTYYSGFEKEQFDNYALRGFNELLGVSPEAYTVIIGDQEKRVIIQQTSKDNVLQILSELNGYKAGDVIRHSQDSYIVMLKPQYNQMYQKSKIEMCNINLKWVDSEGSIQSFPSVFYYNKSSSGIDEGSIINLPNGHRQAVVQKNGHTIKLKRDKRFIIGGEAFKVVDVDYVSDEGLVNLSLQSSADLNSAKDNLELEIADYYDHIADYKINITNGSFATINTEQTLQLNVNVTNRNILVTSPVIEYSLSNTNVASIDSTGFLKPIATGSVFVTATYNNVSTQIEISVTESTAYSYTCEIIGVDDIKKGRTQTYTAKFYRNGVEYPDESKFSLTDDDGISITNLATIGAQDSVNNSCSVIAAQTLGYVRLHLSNANGLATTNKRIRIKPLY
ncbi:hypothetical protein B9T62_14195 [Paenibacillus donghaensis]|uniref:BIG2 domain-containing protein n=2 Tax=Paenibacillus donghaensis TaxID=414771 RepID=A0A2Z2KFC8_9BACL|nr:hypothetical protein B9T62_14195 [Paenibacillus donghaensis]